MHNKHRRFLLALSAAALGLGALAAGPAGAWGLSFGSGERVNGSGEIVGESRDLGPFDAVEVAGDFKLTVRQGAARAELRADKNLLPYIETKVVEGGKGRTLEISAKRGFNLRPTATPQITLDMAQLRAIAIAGSAAVRVEAMKTAAVDASIAGSGDITFININSERLGLKVAGSGDISAAGRTGSLSISVAGSGDVKARALEADEVKVSIAGSGDADVQAARKLSVSISGSGDVSYIGSPEISSSVAGNGKVRKATH